MLIQIWMQVLRIWKFKERKQLTSESDESPDDKQDIWEGRNAERVENPKKEILELELLVDEESITIYHDRKDDTPAEIKIRGNLIWIREKKTD